ncbi:MAG: hypothetical protein JWP56_1499 [Aeromicrobium sp.]|nr:hypothetical protein [Aeromicrobium sp.]
MTATVLTDAVAVAVNESPIGKCSDFDFVYWVDRIEARLVALATATLAATSLGVDSPPSPGEVQAASLAMLDALAGFAVPALL